MSKTYRSAVIAIWLAIIAGVWFEERNSSAHLWLVMGGCQCLGAIAYLVLARGDIVIRLRDALITSLAIAGVGLFTAIVGLVTGFAVTPMQCGAYSCVVNPDVNGLPTLTMIFGFFLMVGMLYSSAMLGTMLLVAKYGPRIGGRIQSFRRA